MNAASVRISEIIKRRTTEGIEESRQKCIEMGIPPQHFNADLARRRIEEDHILYYVSIVEYLDELAAAPKAGKEDA